MTGAIDPNNVQQMADAAKLALEEEQRKGTAMTNATDAVGTAGDAVVDLTVSGIVEAVGSVAGTVVEGAGAVIGGAVEVAGSVIGGIIDGISG